MRECFVVFMCLVEEEQEIDWEKNKIMGKFKCILMNENCEKLGNLAFWLLDTLLLDTDRQKFGYKNKEKVLSMSR